MMYKLLNKGKLMISNISYGIRSFGWKKDDSVVLFGSWFGTKFADNSRFLFQYLDGEKERFGLTHVVWVTRNTEVYDLMRHMGYEVFMMDSEESIYWHKRARYHVICNAVSDNAEFKSDILGQYSYRAKRINLWHGVGGVKGVACTRHEYQEAKKKHLILYTIKEFFLKHCKLYRLFVPCAGGWGDCYYLSTTPAETKILQQRYLQPRKYYIETGYPRNCECLRITHDEQEVINLMKSYKTILYLPTFRSSGADFNTSEIAEGMIDLLERENILWIQKAHTADTNSRFKLGLDGSILSLPPEFDINVLLPYIDLLVTDYSSVASDAMYHHKLVIYYIPDYEEYRRGSRGFAIDPDEMMCGPKTYSLDMLKKTITDYISEPDKGKESKYDRIRSKYWNEICDLGEIWNTIVDNTNHK